MNFSLDEAVDRYEDISKFLALGRSADTPLYEKRETDWFERTMRELKDRRLKTAIKEAMKRYYIFTAALQIKGEFDSKEYEDSEFKVFSLIADHRRSPTLDVEYGIVCKSINECGIYAFFTDDTADKTYYFYRRADKSFSRDKDQPLL